MADKTEILSPEDKEYRAKSIGHMFKMALYGALGGAAFFSVLTGLVNKALSAVAGEAAGAAGVLGMSAGGWAVAAGVMAVGVAFTYMSQIESTKLRELQDDRLARRNADMLRCQDVKLEPAKSASVEYEQNQRADGKKWSETLTQGAAIEGRAY